MIHSMTGFGNATVEYKEKTISVEIKSVNSKFFDLMLKLPTLYREKEMELRTELSRSIERGKVEVLFTYESQEITKKASINKPLVKAYFEELKKLDSELKNITPNYLQLILPLPDVLISERMVLSAEEWKAASNALSLALKNFRDFRNSEGKALEKDSARRRDRRHRLCSAEEHGRRQEGCGASRAVSIEWQRVDVPAERRRLRWTLRE